jgi:pyrimidine operon attenuation protein/uracil phosphoribosyltransferase
MARKVANGVEKKKVKTKVQAPVYLIGPVLLVGRTSNAVTNTILGRMQSIYLSYLVDQVRF